MCSERRGEEEAREEKEKKKKKKRQRAETTSHLAPIKVKVRERVRQYYTHSDT